MTKRSKKYIRYEKVYKRWIHGRFISEADALFFDNIGYQGVKKDKSRKRQIHERYNDPLWMPF